MLPENFYKLVEQKGFLKNILYSDTDSIFILLRTKNVNISTEEKLKLLEKTAENINKEIRIYLNHFLLPRQNISPTFNNTEFKTELLIDSIMFLDVKKSYVYRLLAKEGNILEHPEISYTGVQVVKSDTSNITRKILKHLIDIILSNIPRKYWKIELGKCFKIYKEKFNQMIEDFELSDIGFPIRWNKKEQSIYGMKLYNYIMSEETFSMGSSGYFIYCIFHDLSLFKNINIEDITKITGLCIPYSGYDKIKLKNQMKEFRIEIDKDLQWEKINTTTVKRVVEIIKEIL